MTENLAKYVPPIDATTEPEAFEYTRCCHCGGIWKTEDLIKVGDGAVRDGYHSFCQKCFDAKWHHTDSETQEQGRQKSIAYLEKLGIRKKEEEGKTM
jgi:hypothetical protein